ncbi:DUF3237 domain-containing protein [Mesorhizobium sp.]|uniref:DUF3237 domain-containing protein n=1 Tax=Mesorhizobium sp. TaxID=1871066 RepID=UPI000FEA89C5|nr:DUF3237 domain-containing protein [Mesorhizobium sp.]RWB42849.1 MAG: DUF3237 domain-containing protein [Mesorhizobium sp.]RWB64853.1 MAG: DUF3237 domain-containing protein [Mesorhizobium sp.]RWB88187.1 MAG: DUF3237 domain-containing protein [Mesorhizobium sp.]RWC16750.1 MAG: DUF3237 domain-containing protein [Mesorhizobium sp.]RWD77277.1 MAG: DUF3237 domain-containing protein [Mesorhizobium sp.]
MTQFSEFRVQVGVPLKLGDDGFGEARIVPILGGTALGSGISGRILPGGTDEQRIRADGRTRIHARYVIEAQDGALIRVDSQGLRHGPPEVMAALLRGEKVDSTQVYFRTVIRFETAAPAHDDLNLRLYLANGERQHDCVILRLTELA